MTPTSTRHDAGTAAATAPVTVEQAAAALGVSASTVRRRIRDGSLRAEEARRPQGVVWLVHLPAGTATDATQPPPAAGAVATTPAAAAGEAMVTYTKTLLEPLVAALERTQGRVAELERENGHLAERLAATEVRLRALEVPREVPADGPESRPGGPERAESGRRVPESTPAPSGPWWRRALAALLGAPG
jgi:hypothetical protein